MQIYRDHVGKKTDQNGTLIQTDMHLTLPQKLSRSA
jgi:hypothetical protein